MGLGGPGRGIGSTPINAMTGGMIRPPMMGNAPLMRGPPPPGIRPPNMPPQQSNIQGNIQGGMMPMGGGPMS